MNIKIIKCKIKIQILYLYTISFQIVNIKYIVVISVAYFAVGLLLINVYVAYGYYLCCRFVVKLNSRL
jgi:hypothetical protein